MSLPARKLAICVVLAAITLATYWPVRQFDFVNFDDHDYVTENPHVQGGLSWAGVGWAFRTRHAANWHPLTWLSHQLDCQLFGLRPAGHHLTNLLFHTANALLLFLLFHRMTGALWRSAFVAALFALHPLHVESVAWVSERKDLLSTFFGLLALWAYVRYVQSKVQGPKAAARRAKADIQGSKFRVQGSTFPAAPSILHPPSSTFYLLSLCLFAFSLMSKPMLVTLPFVLLLLDFWPLQRWPQSAAARPSRLDPQPRTVTPRRWLLVEKLPFLGLAVASSLITLVVQRTYGAVAPVAVLPVDQRLANALVAYGRYLRKLAWPDDLAVFYPHPGSWPWWQVLGTGLILVTATVLLIRARHRRPAWLVGWLWFLGMLVPAIGLVQVGYQSMADRYSYLPLVGLFVALVWAVAELSDRWPYRSRVVPGAAILLLVLCAALSRRQVGFWRNNLTLFERDLAVTTNNFLAHLNLGGYLEKQGQFEEARRHFIAAARIFPSPDTHYALGRMLLQGGQASEAIEQYDRALRFRPDWDGVLNNLAWLLATHPRAEVRDGPRAVSLAERACQLTGGTNLWMVSTLAAAYAEAGRFPEAVSTQQRVCDLAAAQGQSNLAERFQRRLELYRSGQPYHEP